MNVLHIIITNIANNNLQWGTNIFQKLISNILAQE